MLQTGILFAVIYLVSSQTTTVPTAQEPPPSTALFNMTWLPPSPKTQACGSAPRPWMATLKEQKIGTTKFIQLPTTNVFDDFLEPHPDIPEDCIENVERMTWHRVDPNGGIYETRLDAQAMKVLKNLGQLTPEFGSVGPEVLRVAGFKGRRSVDETEEQSLIDDLNSNERERRFLFGTDDRVRIPCGSQGSFPTSVIGKVTSGCTGTLIGPRHVLTAGHCVHSGGSSGDWFYGVTFKPQINCANQAVAEYGWSNIWSVLGWTRDKDFSYDYALIELSSSPGLGWMSFGYNSGISTGWGFNIRGYMSQDKPSYEIYNAYQAGIISAGSNVLKHTNDIVRGTSGAAMYAYFTSSGARVIYGIQSHHACPNASISGTFGEKCSSSSGYNGATRITSDRFNQICGWMNTPYVC